MCKGCLIAMLCPKGWRDGWACPHNKISADGRPYFKPYFLISPNTDYECCGLHQGSCEECLDLYQPGNITYRIMEHVECDDCQKTINTMRENGEWEYVQPSVEQCQLELPELIKQQTMWYMSEVTKNNAEHWTSALQERAQELEDWKLTRLIFEGIAAEQQQGESSAMGAAQLQPPFAVQIPEFGGENTLLPPQNQQQNVAQLQEQGYFGNAAEAPQLDPTMSEFQTNLSPFLQQSLELQQMQLNEPFLTNTGEALFQPNVAQGQSYTAQLFTSSASGQSDQSGSMLPQQTFGLQANEEDAFNFLGTANPEQNFFGQQQLEQQQLNQLGVGLFDAQQPQQQQQQNDFIEFFNFGS